MHLNQIFILNLMLGGESKITEAIEDAMLYLGQKHKVKPVILM